MQKIWSGSWVDATLCPVATPLDQVQVPAQSRDRWHSNISPAPPTPKCYLTMCTKRGICCVFISERA